MTSRRSALLVVPALVLPALVPVSADASGYDWKYVTSVAQGSLQACKLPTTKTGPWRIKLRLDARKATEPVKGSARAYKGSTALKSSWASAYIQPGKVSAIGEVRLPRGSRYHILGKVRSASGVTNSATPETRLIPICA